MSAELLTTLLPLATVVAYLDPELPILVFQQLKANQQKYREVMKR